MNRQRVLSADVDDPARRPRDKSTNDHAFDHGMRVALDLIAVHVRTGIALVRIADDILLVAGGVTQDLPLQPRRKPRPTAPTQLGKFDLFDNALGVTVDQYLIESLIAPHSEVLFDVGWVDEAAVPQHDPLLPVEERHLVPVRQFGVSSAELDVAGNVVPFFNLAER